jgi:hypothetical protein
MKRLDGLDLLLTDWMLGFSILLLIAIRFAPGIVGKQINARTLESPRVFKLRQGGNPSLSPLDFKNPVHMVAIVRDARDPVSQYLLESLTPETRAQIKEWNTSDLPDALFGSIIEQLNQMLNGSNIYNEQRFAQVPLTDEAHRLIGQSLPKQDLPYLNRLLLEQAYPGELIESRKEFIAEADTDTNHPIELCPTDNTPLQNHWCKTCGRNYPIQLVSGRAQNILLFLLLLFVVKYIHERSVLRFRLYEDDRDGSTEAAFRSEMETLRNRSNNAMLHFFVFIFRIAFLGAFYLFLINLYLRSNGQFQDFKDATYYGAVLICGYFAPDLCLFLATKGAAYVALKSWLHQRMVRFLVVLVVMFLLCFLAIVKWNVPALLGFLIFLVALLVLLGFSSAAVLSKFEQHSVEITSLKWLLLDVFNVIALVTFGIAAYMQNIDITWIACGVLIVNVFDWAFNSWFYFSSYKFGIHAKLKPVT